MISETTALLIPYYPLTAPNQGYETNSPKYGSTTGRTFFWWTWWTAILVLRCDLGEKANRQHPEPASPWRDHQPARTRCASVSRPCD